MRTPAIFICALLTLAFSSPADAEPWPYMPFDQTHGLGNHFGEYQNYGGGGYYHDGIDLVTPAGPVATYSVSTGTLTHITINQPLYSGIMIGQPVSGGQGWLYWHINSTTFQFDVGDQVRVISGAFANFSGTVEEVKADRQKVKVIVPIFGRPTPVELGYNEVEKITA